MELYISDISALYKNSVDGKVLDHITEEKKHRISKYVRNEDKIRSYVADIILRFCIMKQLHIENDDISFTYNDYGKAFLQNCEKFHFNISHSGKYVAVIIDDEVLGLDIDKIQDDDTVQAIEKSFSSEERAYVYSLDLSNRNEYYSKLWTLKESFVKCTGKGLNIPFNSFSIIEPITNKTGNAYIENKNYLFYSQKIDDEYFFSVCSRSSYKDLHIRKISAERIVNEFNEMFHL